MRNFIAILITIIPVFLLNVYFVYTKEPNSGMNWIHSFASAVVLMFSYSFANHYRKNDKIKISMGVRKRRFFVRQKDKSGLIERLWLKKHKIVQIY